MWLSDVNEAIAKGESADPWADCNSQTSSGSVRNGPSKSDHLVTAYQNGSWIGGEGIYLRSSAGRDCYRDGLFDIAGSVGADGCKSIGSRGVG